MSRVTGGLKKKKGSVSERLNEELNPFANQADAFDDDEGPQVETFDASADAPRSGRSADGGRKARKEDLRRRGPLDPSLSSGRYAAKPRGSALNEELMEDDTPADDNLDVPFDKHDATANMDDIFGMLDGDEFERNSKFKSEDDVAAYLDTRPGGSSSKRRRTAAPGTKRPRSAIAEAEDEEVEEVEEEAIAVKRYSKLNADDADVMRQIDDLRRTTNLAVTPQLETGAAEALQKEVQFGRNCLALNTQLLTCRLRMQPAVHKAVQLPQYYAIADFERRSDAVADALAEARSSAMELTVGACALAGVPGLKTKSGEPINFKSSDALFKRLSARHSALMERVDAGIERWGHRAQSSADPKAKAANRPLKDQIQGVIGGRQRLLHRAQRNRTHQHIYGHPAHFGHTQADRAVAIAEGDEDREVFDDSDFVKDLALQQGGSAATMVSEVIAEDRSKSEAKRGHHRLTKGRTVNYDPRPKLVGFMAAQPADESNDKYDALLSSLFGQASRRRAVA